MDSWEFFKFCAVGMCFISGIVFMQGIGTNLHQSSPYYSIALSFCQEFDYDRLDSLTSFGKFQEYRVIGYCGKIEEGFLEMRYFEFDLKTNQPHFTEEDK